MAGLVTLITRRSKKPAKAKKPRRKRVMRRVAKKQAPAPRAGHGISGRGMVPQPKPRTVAA